jgi:hypothetical protein
MVQTIADRPKVGKPSSKVTMVLSCQPPISLLAGAEVAPVAPPHAQRRFSARPRAQTVSVGWTRIARFNLELQPLS